MNSSIALASALHILAAVIWVGGMFFAHQILRPVAASLLQPPERLSLWSRVFARFFPWVWVCIVALPLSGYWMIFRLFGGLDHVGLHVHGMHILAYVMIAIFCYVYFIAYRRLREAVAIEQWPDAAQHLAAIRRLIGVNLSIGLLVIAIASGGRLI